MLASAHVGYHAPRDSPREPTVEELQAFPVALKCHEVDGTPVVSQTVYVGREFRGRDGEPDTGRFGNYFSHIVLADPDAVEPFDGLLAIELWKAPHWRSSESETPQLPELGALQPGRCDLEWAFEQVGESSKAWFGAVLDGVLAAIGGGPRVVLVEPDVERAAAWVAWVSYALPVDLASALTFTTFDGQPRHALDVQLCLTTPGCDLGFAEHELGREVVLLDCRVAKPPSPGLLYARVAAALADDGPEAIAAAIAHPSAGSVQQRGAQLAVLSGRVGLALEEHVPSILKLVVQLAERGEWELALKTASELPQSAGSEETLRGWWMVHASAREVTAEPARELVDQALKRLIQNAPPAPEGLPAVSCDSPTSPSPGLLASWLETVDECRPGPARAALLDGGLRLGLIGCNVALDRRVAGAISDAIGTPEVAATLTRLAAGQRHADIVEEVIARLAREAFADERAMPRLRNVLADPALGDATRRLAARAGEFDERAVWERLRVEADPSTLSDALATLVPIAERAGRSSEVKRLFGPDGPVGPEDHAVLLRAFVHAGVGAPEEDIDASLAALAQMPLTDASRGHALVSLLRSTAPRRRLHEDPVFLAWAAACNRPRANFDEWCEGVADAAAAPADRLPDERFRELWELAGAVAVASLDFPSAQNPGEQRYGGNQPGSEAERPYHPMADYVAGMHRLARAFGRHWPEAVARALELELSKGRDKAWFGATAFLAWRALPAETGDLLETALPEAIETLSSRRIQAIEALLGDREQAEWARWLARHPPRPRAGGTVARLLRRDGRRA